MAFLYPGSDNKINVTVVRTYVNTAGDEVTEPVNLTLFNGYVIVLYYEGTGTVLDSFSKVPATGYVTITEIDPTNGVVQLWLDKTVTTTAPEGNIVGEIKTSLLDTDFSQDSFRQIQPFPVAPMKKAETKTTNVPVA